MQAVIVFLSLLFGGFTLHPEDSAPIVIEEPIVVEQAVLSTPIEVEQPVEVMPVSYPVSREITGYEVEIPFLMRNGFTREQAENCMRYADFDNDLPLLDICSEYGY